jgi:phenylalanyl-tRNA synthetase beta subunit
VAIALNDIDLESSVTPIDIYQADGSTTKNVTVRIKLTAHDRTMTGEEVANLMTQINTAVIADTNATVI